MDALFYLVADTVLADTSGGEWQRLDSTDPRPPLPWEGEMLVDEEVGRAVTALQFHDLATQLLGHARKRIAVAEEGLKKLTVLPLSGTAADWGAPPDLAAPVGHANLETGTVELF